MEKVFEIYIRTTPERLWEAITEGEVVRKSFGRVPEGGGGTVEEDPPRRLVQTMEPRWDDEVKAEPPSRITWEIEPRGDMCRLTVVHSELREEASPQLYGGWPMILSSLKSMVETGEPLRFQIPEEVRGS